MMLYAAKPKPVRLTGKYLFEWLITGHIIKYYFNNFLWLTPTHDATNYS